LKPNAVPRRRIGPGPRRRGDAEPIGADALIDRLALVDVGDQLKLPRQPVAKR
jgi:hypothetical protein